jgi:hypothetical protein
MQLGMCLGTAVLGLLILVLGGSSELGPFGWLFVVLGVLGTIMWVVLPSHTRR